MRKSPGRTAFPFHRRGPDFWCSRKPYSLFAICGIKNSRLLRMMGGFISWRTPTVTQNLSHLSAPNHGRRQRRKKTLRIVAKHADACNLFGSPETIRRKLGVLFDHCKKIGRNYNTILKTKLSHVIIAKEREEAERRVNERFGEMDKESRREFMIYGNPADVQMLE